MKSEIRDCLDVLEELCDEGSVPRNIKAKFKEICKALSTEGETSVHVNKALHELDEITDDNNLQPFIRTQIWNMVSLLEKCR